MNSSREYIYFFINEILTILINIVCYNLLVNLDMNVYISSIVAFVISMIINYFLCLKIVFKNKEHLKFKLFKFILYDTGGHLIKHFLIKILYYKFSIYLLLAKILVNIMIFIYDYVTKRSVFDKKYSLKNTNIIIKNIGNYWYNFINLRYVSFLFKFLPRNLFVFIFFIGSIYYSLLFIRDNNDLILYKQEIADSTIGEFINKEINVSFSNIDVNNDVNRICLVFGTYGRNNDSNLVFKLYKLDKEIISKKINTNVLKDGQGYCFNVSNIKKSDIKQYELKVISKNANKENNITLFKNKETDEVALYLKNNRSLFDIKNLVVIMYVVVFLLINFNINKEKGKLNVNKFLLLMLVYTLSILFIYPPLETPDEPSHMHSSYNLSQNLFDADITTKISVPSNIDCLNYSKIQHLDRVTNFKDVSYCLKESDVNKTVDHLFGSSNKVTNSFLGHLPQALSIKIIDRISDSPLFIFYCARLGNFILSFIILYCAIKMAPKGKNILLFVSVLPMFVQQITSLSYDAILNSLALLYTAYIIKIYNQKDKIKWKDIIIPVVFLLVSFSVKVVYIPLAILLLFIPKDKFKNMKQFIAFNVCIISLVLVGNYIIKEMLFIAESTVDIEFDNQLNYLLSRPLDIIKIGLNTLSRNGVFYLRGIVGYFGWFRFRLSDFTVIACLLLFVILGFSENEILNFDKRKENSRINYKKSLVVISVLFSIAAIFLSMYLCWSEYMLPYVDGVQGRYFIPLIAIIVLLIIPKVKKININQCDLYIFINVLLWQYVIYAITFFY